MDELKQKQIMFDAMMNAENQKHAIELFITEVSKEDTQIKAFLNDEEKGLDKCWGYIESKARKTFKNNAEVKPDIVFGWALHYYIEPKEVIDEELGKSDKPQENTKKSTNSKPKKTTKAKAVEKTEGPKITRFDIFSLGDEDDT